MNSALRQMRRVLGNSTTSETQLSKAGHSLFGKRFKGVFAANEKRPKKGFMIVNTLPRGTAGEHWFAIADGLIYDSFGRDASGDAEQDMREKNCGQRSLAWLCTYEDLGREAASLV